MNLRVTSLLMTPEIAIRVVQSVHYMYAKVRSLVCPTG